MFVRSFEPAEETSVIFEQLTITQCVKQLRDLSGIEGIEFNPVNYEPLAKNERCYAMLLPIQKEPLFANRKTIINNNIYVMKTMNAMREDCEQFIFPQEEAKKLFRFLFYFFEIKAARRIIASYEKDTRSVRQKVMIDVLDNMATLYLLYYTRGDIGSIIFKNTVMYLYVHYLSIEDVKSQLSLKLEENLLRMLNIGVKRDEISSVFNEAISHRESYSHKISIFFSTKTLGGERQSKKEIDPVKILISEKISKDSGIWSVQYREDYKKYLEKLKQLDEREVSFFGVKSIVLDDAIPTVAESRWVLADNITVSDIYCEDGDVIKAPIVAGRRRANAGIEEIELQAWMDWNRSLSGIFVDGMNLDESRKGNQFESPKELETFIKTHLLRDVQYSKLQNFLCKEAMANLYQTGIMFFTNNFFAGCLVNIEEGFDFRIRQPNTLVRLKPIIDGFEMYLESSYQISLSTIEADVGGSRRSVELNSIPLGLPYFLKVSAAFSMTADYIEESDSYKARINFLEKPSIHCLDKEFEKFVVEKINQLFGRPMFVEAAATVNSQSEAVFKPNIS